MKLVTNHSRTYKGRKYYKSVVVIPNDQLALLKWKKGDVLSSTVVGDQLVIRKGPPETF